MMTSGLLASAFLLACGPSFPVSYFPGEDGSAYRVTPHLGTELSMIGARYYPEWTGKAPKGNRISSERADELDFFAAGRACRPATAVTEDWRRYVAFRDGVCKRLEAGERVELPPGIPDYALEFYLYRLGHAQWLVFRKDEDPAPFAQLLALPKERRLYRTVWVHFVRLANARTFPEKDRHLRAMRKALDDGFKDTSAIECFAIRFLSHTCDNRYDPLVLTAYAQAPWDEWPAFAQRIFCRRHPSRLPKRAWIERMCADPVGVEVAVAFGAGGNLPAGAVRPETPVLGADRQAWIAFNRGDLDLCRKLLPLAPEQSLVRLFLEARLARLDGDYGRAAERLHEWLKVYRGKGLSSDAAVTGYVIASGDDYWQDGEPTLPRIVAGELGVVMVETRDFEEALHAFLLARNWIDIAFVAERCMTVDELIRFVDTSPIVPSDRHLLCNLLMRRLVREGRLDEAVRWAPKSIRPLCEEYRALWTAAHGRAVSPLTADADTRAVAFFNLSRLTLTRGMELMGTELRPDVAIYDGCYAEDGLPSSIFNRQSSTSTNTFPTVRFHYRYKGLEFARSAADLAQDPNVRAWSLMLGGVAALSRDDVQSADWFYKRLARMNHPRAKVGQWFDSPEYQWFRKEYYDDERHRVPMRVPPRLTKGQFAELKLQEETK